MLAYRQSMSPRAARRGWMSLDWFRELVVLAIPTLLLGWALTQAWSPEPAEHATHDPSRYPIHIVRTVDDGRQLWVGRWNHECQTLDADRLTEVSGYLAREYELALCSRASGTVNLSMMVRFDNRLEIYRDEQLIHQETLSNNRSWATDTDLSTDGRVAVMSRTDGTGRRWRFDADRRVEVQDFDFRDQVNGVAFRPHSTQFLTYSQRDFALWDAERLVPIRSWAYPATSRRPRPLCVAWAPQGTAVFAGFDDGTVVGWDPETGTQLGQWTAGDYGVAALAVSPDGRTLATGGFDKIVRLWSSDGQALHWAGTAHTSTIRGLAFDQAGRRVISGGLDGKLFAWKDGVPSEIR